MGCVETFVHHGGGSVTAGLALLLVARHVVNMWWPMIALKGFA